MRGEIEEIRARLFATAAHAAVGQKRKYTGEPYINHPAEVVEIVKTVTDNSEMICAAWLHDVVEDTEITLEVIEEHFGNRVRELVYWLTDVSKPEDGNRAARKAIDRQHIACAPAAAQTVKLADLISNTASIVERDPDFAKVYLKEKALLLEVLTRGEPTLWHRAYGLVKAH
jgi:guanosine-3',5'-bis(diphosphate) 3'-pyrophosphohydrolase